MYGGKDGQVANVETRHTFLSEEKDSNKFAIQGPKYADNTPDTFTLTVTKTAIKGTSLIIRLYPWINARHMNGIECVSPKNGKWHFEHIFVDLPVLVV